MQTLPQTPSQTLRNLIVFSTVYQQATLSFLSLEEQSVVLQVDRSRHCKQLLVRKPNEADETLWIFVQQLLGSRETCELVGLRELLRTSLLKTFEMQIFVDNSPD